MDMNMPGHPIEKPKPAHRLRTFHIEYHTGGIDIIEAHAIHFNNSMIALWENTGDDNMRLLVAINTELIRSITEEAE